MALFKSNPKKEVQYTLYQAISFEVSGGEEERFFGSLLVQNKTDFSKITFDWVATHSGNEHWEVLPAHNARAGTGKVDKGFTHDSMYNVGIKAFISGELVLWRKSQKKNVPAPAPATPSPTPMPPPPPAVLARASALLHPQQGISGEQILQIPLDECICFQKQESDPAFSGQPRKFFDDNDLKKLAGSLKKHGQKVPALVRRNDTIPGKKWEIIAGERRWRALQLIGFSHLRAIEEKPESKKQQHMLALIENLFRVDPSPLELSNALQEQVNAGETQVSLAEATSLSLSHVRSLLSIQSIHPDLKALLHPSNPEESRMRLLEASTLAKIHPDHQVEIWNEAKNQPSHRLIVAKIQQLGKALFQDEKCPRITRHNEPREVLRRVSRRMGALMLAMIEFKAVTPEE